MARAVTQGTLPLRSRSHAGDLRTSPRLQATLRALLDAGGRASSREIRAVTESEAVHSDIHALRQRENGCRISQHYAGRTARGARISVYVLEHAPAWAREIARGERT